MNAQPENEMFLSILRLDLTSAPLQLTSFNPLIKSLKGEIL